MKAGLRQRSLPIVALICLLFSDAASAVAAPPQSFIVPPSLPATRCHASFIHHGANQDVFCPLRDEKPQGAQCLCSVRTVDGKVFSAAVGHAEP